MAAEEISVSKTINAPIEKVWALVSDLESMGKRSPQCKVMKVVGGAPHKGSWTINLNRKGLLWWPTWSVVTAWDSLKTLEFKIPLNSSRWRFELTCDEPNSIGGHPKTTVTHKRLVDGNTTAVSRALVSVALGGEKSFETDLRAGMEQTLESLAQEAESTEKINP